ncbi:hypothetical protein M1N87_02070 [Dehalococcoidia bacterium]|nr:hypothetical protein [Dehalococcoidia bacterium]
MKLKGIRSIALLVAAVILVIGSVAGIAAAGGEERDEEFRWDACYWWETPPLTAYERQQMKDIMVHIFNHYFGMDISRKSPKELVELGYAIGHQNQQKALRLFWSYAEERGFELPLGILDVPAEPRQEFIPRPDAYYWWEFIDPERWCDEWLTRMKKEFPDIDIMRLTPEEMDDLLNPPAPPLRLIPIEEKKQCPGVHAVFGRARTYTSEAEIREWLDRLFEVIGGDPPLCGQLRCAFFVRTLAVSGSGYVTVDLDADRATREEVVRLAPKIYAVITQRAEELGIEDVPVAFRHTRLVRLPYNCRSGEPVRMEKIIPPLPAACFMRFKRQGLDFEIIQQLLMADRVEIAPATMEPLVPEEVPLPTPRVSSSSAAPKPPAHQEKDRRP